ncbi:unnamed protein product [Paramecium pentaurelia]|uniref:Uncharacterized protein n=1 Tax=Paramecium pentaurelia TaxID=43138 RepID=A0A8S1UQX3_9CILI|nr:unnamed protein product [Paramecium pentaurelia]
MIKMMMIFFEREQQQIKQPPPHQVKAILQEQIPLDLQDIQLDNTKTYQIKNELLKFLTFKWKSQVHSREFGLSMNMPKIKKQVQSVFKKVDDEILIKERGNQRYLKNLMLVKMAMFHKQIYINETYSTQDEIQLLIQYVDPENKGFANFTEFAQKIRNGMTILDENGAQLINVNTQPSKTTIIAATSFLLELQRSINEFKKPFIASKNRFDYKPSTRYGATPSLKDTFVNIAPLERSGLWKSAESRFNKNREEYKKEDKKLKEFRQEQKLQRIRSYQQEIRDRIKSQDDRHKQKAILK